jgi:hypothetical protein
MIFTRLVLCGELHLQARIEDLFALNGGATLDGESVVCHTKYQREVLSHTALSDSRALIRGHRDNRSA